MKRTTLSKDQILIDGATMFIQKVKNPDNFLELLTESMYQTFLIAGKTDKAKFDEVNNNTFELKLFIDKVASRLFYDEDVSIRALTDGMKEFLEMGGLKGYDGVMQAIIIAFGENFSHSNYTEAGMGAVIPNLGILCDLREYVRQYEKAEQLLEAAI